MVIDLILVNDSQIILNLISIIYKMGVLYQGIQIRDKADCFYFPMRNGQVNFF